MRRAGNGTTVALVAVAVGLLGSGALVWQSSRAAFSGSTSNAANNWTSGSVTLTNNRGAAMFSVSAVKPNDPHQRCIQVTYGGNLAAAVKLYGANYTDNGLAGSLKLTVEEGSGGVFNNAECDAGSGFTPTTVIWDGALANHSVADFATKTDFSSGVGTWAPTGSAQTKVYRFTYELTSSTTAVQNKTSQLDFVWEAQNS